MASTPAPLGNQSPRPEASFSATGRAPAPAVAIALALIGCGPALGTGRASQSSVQGKASLASAIAEHPWDGRPSSPTPRIDVRAHRYAALDAMDCARMLARRRVLFDYVPFARGVNAPIRLRGPLNGVDIHGEPSSHRKTSPYEVLDCRLAVALDDFTRLLASYGVVEVIHMSMYRPPSSSPQTRRSQHGAGLAIDIGAFVLRDGTRVTVRNDWAGGIGKTTCPSKGWTEPASERSKLLEAILCTAADEGMFNLYLTPNYDRRHFDHFHLEVTRGAKWFIVH